MPFRRGVGASGKDGEKDAGGKDGGTSGEKARIVKKRLAFLPAAWYTFSKNMLCPSDGRIGAPRSRGAVSEGAFSARRFL